MTLSDLTSKTPEELNVMCAELCGYKEQRKYGASGAYISQWEKDGQLLYTKDLPNYTGSWDAIMPEVRKLNRTKFMDNLLSVIVGQEKGFNWADCDDGDFHAMVIADAQQLTIALILTLTSQH